MISAIPYTANPFYGDFHWKEMNHKYDGMFVCLIGCLHKVKGKLPSYKFEILPQVLGFVVGNHFQV